MARLWFLVALAACYQPAPIASCAVSCDVTNPACPGGMTCEADLLCHEQNGDTCGGHGNDGGEDAQTCVTSSMAGIGPICVKPPSSMLVLDGKIDTDTDNRCASHAQLDGPVICVVAGTDVEVPSVNIVHVTGSRPLLILATATLTVDGTIDIASHRGDPSVGAGADDSTCSNGTGGGNSVTGFGGGGGAGGAFQGDGGAGGSGDGGNATGGVSIVPAGLDHLRGGCPGGAGGLDSMLGPPNGGHSGGALYLMAGVSISVSGTINASGEGGGGAAPEQGGGGGGAGGMIVLDTKDIELTMTASIFANGGGGSGGAGGSATANGDDPVVALNRAGGSMGTLAVSGTGGAGGLGSAGLTLNGVFGTDGMGDTLNPGGAGGGGGGGAGFVRFFTSTESDTGAKISPPALR